MGFASRQEEEEVAHPAEEEANGEHSQSPVDEDGQACLSMTMDSLVHLKRPDLKGTFACSLCRKQFCHSSSLSRHKMQAHLRRFRCTLCHKQIANSDALRAHMASEHQSGRVFLCRCCNWAFRDKNELHRHLKSRRNIPVAKEEEKTAAMPSSPNTIDERPPPDDGAILGPLAPLPTHHHHQPQLVPADHQQQQQQQLQQQQHLLMLWNNLLLGHQHRIRELAAASASSNDDGNNNSNGVKAGNGQILEEDLLPAGTSSRPSDTLAVMEHPQGMMTSFTLPCVQSSTNGAPMPPSASSSVLGPYCSVSSSSSSSSSSSVIVQNNGSSSSSTMGLALPTGGSPSESDSELTIISSHNNSQTISPSHSSSGGSQSSQQNGPEMEQHQQHDEQHQSCVDGAHLQHHHHQPAECCGQCEAMKPRLALALARASYLEVYNAGFQSELVRLNAKCLLAEQCIRRLEVELRQWRERNELLRYRLLECREKSLSVIQAGSGAGIAHLDVNAFVGEMLKITLV